MQRTEQAIREMPARSQVSHDQNTAVCFLQAQHVFGVTSNYVACAWLAREAPADR